MNDSATRPDLEALRAQIEAEVRAELRSEWERVQRAQQDALLALTRSVQILDAEDAFRRVTEVAARTMGVQRVSVWFHDRETPSIRSQDLFELDSGAHSSGIQLMRADYPAYFSALEENRTIVAHDAHHDPATSEFSQSYLGPLGISS